MGILTRFRKDRPRRVYVIAEAHTSDIIRKMYKHRLRSIGRFDIFDIISKGDFKDLEVRLLEPRDKKRIDANFLIKEVKIRRIFLEGLRDNSPIDSDLYKQALKQGIELLKEDKGEGIFYQRRERHLEGVENLIRNFTLRLNLTFSMIDHYNLRNYQRKIRWLDEGCRPYFDLQSADPNKNSRKWMKLQKLREQYWLNQVDENFKDPSLLICGMAHVINVMDQSYTAGSFLTALRKKGYIAEIYHLDTTSIPNTDLS